MKRLDNSLSQRRQKIENIRDNLPVNAAHLEPSEVSKDILSSWARSAEAVNTPPKQAPLDDASLASHLWDESPLSKAIGREESNIIQLTKEAQLVAAISDPSGRILWTQASDHMQRRSERLNFVAGGHWDEASVGTNAIGLSLKLKRPSTVFSAEHFLPSIDEWVCYAAPIIHPKTGECYGVLDMSTTWKKHTPFGQSAIKELARSIALGLPDQPSRSELEIYALGQPKVLFHGKEIRIPLRQLEILCLLALNPEGLNLEQLYSAIYPYESTSIKTLKAEVSHLRGLLNGNIGSRPYRLNIPFWADFLEIWSSIKKKQFNEAITLYRGEFLINSKSPEIEEWRYCISALMDNNLGACDSELLMEKMHSSASGKNSIRDYLNQISKN